MKLNKKYIIPIVIILAFIITQVIIRSYISKQPEYREIMTSNPFSTLPPTDYLGTYIATVALGGFKPLLVDYLWIKQDRLQEDKQFEEIRLLLTIIARLQPRFVEVWSFNAYHMIYNIAFQEKTPEEKWHWVKSGIDYIKEGLRHNPHSGFLTQWIAFFYYHRIPQDIYLMQQVEKTEGLDTYEVAGKWYQETVDLYKKEGASGAANMYRTMYFACRFLHSFELVRKDKFDDAVKELEYIINYTGDEVEKNRLKDLIEILKYDKEISKINLGDPDFISKNSSLLEQYETLINKHIGFDFRPINDRVEFLLAKYIQNSYYLIDNSRYKEASEQIKLLLEITNKILPKLDDHPAQWYYSVLIERFGQLGNLINGECYLKAGGIKDFNSDQRGMELKSLYEQYLKKYSRWLLADEKERFNKLYK